ncbi:glycoside hydrolase family protein [Gracilibacillus halophilus YIM-C55.5]|uniref:licheninase n=2 Tax=Gracilibacillus TaxID=74385 RepID=N4WSR9_9BACI|nr:glycoside hydrolase family protein [Gracilibacillus halophilus YIM-C55.5]
MQIHTAQSFVKTNKDVQASLHMIKQRKIQTAYQEEDWSLVWHDEFSQDALNPNHWNTEQWASEKNQELQYYHPKNVAVTDGKLQIISKKENDNGRKYTSGAIHSKDLVHFQYGKVEMRAKLPTGKGVFPAFWMMPNKEDTWLPEIDIVEMLGDEPEKVWMTQHWLDEEETLRSRSDTYVGDNFSKDYHTFGIEWTPHEIKWFIDGEEQFYSHTSVPSESMYLYINTAIGGEWPGRPDATTRFPQTFSVDYVRIYQKTEVNP